MRDMKLAKQVFEAEMQSCVKYARECLTHHPQCRANSREGMAQTFGMFLMADEACVPNACLPFLMAGVQKAVSDTEDRIWNKWAFAPVQMKNNRIDTMMNVVSVNSDGTLYGVWSPTQNVMFATVEYPSLKVTACEHEVAIKPTEKLFIVGELKNIIRNHFSKELKFAAANHPDGLMKLTDLELLDLKSTILNEAMEYDSNGPSPPMQRLLETVTEHARQSHIDELMNMADLNPTALFIFCNETELVDSEGKHWRGFKSVGKNLVSGSVVCRCVEDGNIGCFSTKTLLLEWLYDVKNCDVYHAVMSSTRHISRKYLHETAYAQLMQNCSA